MNKRYLTSLKLAALAVAGLLLGSSATRAQTPFPTPVGDWDIVSSGKEQGLVILTFASDGTLGGYKIVRPVPRKTSSPDVNPRHPNIPGDDTERTTGSGLGGSTTPKPSTNFLGSADIDGAWAFDSAGKILGFLNQISVNEIKPVEEISTNVIDGFIVLSTNIVLKGVTTTNAVSFRGSVVPGSRITICTYGPNGNNTLKGKPRTDPGNLGGGFYAVGKRGSINFVEFPDLVLAGGIPTLYNVTGTGPGYMFTGAALVSNQKKIAVLTLSSDGTPVLSVYTGSFNLTSRKGKLSGEDSNGKKLNYNFNPLP